MTEEQTPALVGVIVVAHSDYGTALLRTVELILGNLSDCTSISVDAEHDVQIARNRLDDAANLLDKGAGVLILTDMFGGTPANLSLSLLEEHRVEVVTGVNVPMALKVFANRDKPLAELAAMAGEAGASGIVVAGRMLKKGK